MDLEKSKLIKCKHCAKDFAVNSFQNHLAKKPVCKNGYLPEELSELKEMCHAHSIKTKREINRIAYQNKNNKLPKVLCKGCEKFFLVNTINHHLKQKEFCRNSLSETDITELENICKSHRDKSKASWHHKQKPVVRPREEIEKIIKAMTEIRETSIQHCILQMNDNIKYDVCILREMKKFFRNQEHVEHDIKEFIKETLTQFNFEYEYSMKEVVWTMDFLLSNPHVSIHEEVKDLKIHLSDIEFPYQAIPDYSRSLFDIYKNNVIRQLPEEVKNHFQFKYGNDTLTTREIYQYPQQNQPSIYHYIDVKLKDLGNNYLCPYKDPNILINEENYVDEFTIYLKNLCKICGKIFIHKLKHLENPDVSCAQYYDELEIQALKQNQVLEAKHLHLCY